jgi:hypothetical protein
MPLVTVAQARAQARVEDSYPEAQLTAALKGAEDAAQAYLNRAVFATSAELAADRAAYATRMATAKDDYDAAVAAAELITNETEKAAALEMAAVQYHEEQAAADRSLHAMVTNDSIVSAILLTFGHLFANREDVVVGAPAVELPLGARSLLRPYRRVMMP